MQLNKLVIHNFGIYYGRNEFDFQNEDDKNIILIGGENGSGKTTFLTAVKVALYGPLILGYKSVNASYIDFIRDKFNIYSLEDGDNFSSVEVDFSLRQYGELHQYIVKRQWILQKGNVKETVNILKGKKSLSDKEVEDFQHFLRRHLPPTLFDFFFFDGEKVHQYVLDRAFESNIKDAFMTLFNLDLFEILQSDLLKYLRQENIFSNLSDEEKLYTQVKLDVTNQENFITSLEQRILKLKEQYKESQIKLSELEKEFTNHGGIVAKEREHLNRDIIEMEQEKKRLSEEMKEIIATLLPFTIQRNLLQKAVTQLNQEEEVQQYEILKNKLGEQLLPNIFEGLSKSYKIKNENDEIVLTEFVDKFKMYLYEKMKPTGININRFTSIHELTGEQKKTIEELYREVSTFRGQNIVEKFNKMNELVNLIYQKRKQIEHSLKDDSLKEIVNKMNEETKVLEQLRYEIEANEEKLVQAKKFLDDLLSQLQKVEKRVYQAKKDENIFGLTQRLNLVLSKYQQRQIEKYLQKVETYFLQMFNSLMRKGQFLNKFYIDPNTFEISMLNHKDAPVFKHSFSAGETQIFFLSLLWALLKAAKADIPFVLDTLFGRLDHSHKENLIKKFLPFSAKQVIILSTDTEIDEQYYQELKSQISREYVIHFNRETNAVEIRNEYFFPTKEVK
ncbi:DNA sulfur modification protein DndD [Bacillus kexueae]|uniref:DNA sulfur modification protein DndD n=1 Tax=Aeribacillus kexueae TaxID=2078952 RepID=UPI001FB034D8|nr:DNA sulfur modification protein DndD [Bacillus kexueae]